MTRYALLFALTILLVRLIGFIVVAVFALCRTDAVTVPDVVRELTRMSGVLLRRRRR
ncbi:hypothetical protein [Actinacidiphila yeochonensis]|uniref:hypothetical protein n=1 Tax=Actinacidiphila yeochonensis TaxID=89050 RepID=UPI000A4F302F|nr:hypothetical protein [Actinacidiphila yeochonensis]